MFKNKKYYKFFYIWLFLLIMLVALIIIVGGLTRLTESGLSITKWELFSGILFPMNEDQWELYFSLYKKIPQYVFLYPDMTLVEFKYIFIWEYSHRLLARLIGLFFLIPFLFFYFTKSLNKNLSIQLMYIFILILIQGFAGWFMVQSGLVNDVTVSHYRLAFHLCMAFIILSLLVWLFLNLKFSISGKYLQNNTNFNFPKILLVLIFVQIIMGALVSGLDAGKAYQTWPLMNGTYFPNDSQLSNLFNFDKPSIVQFFHRNLAYVILCMTIYYAYFIIKNNLKKIYYPYLLFLSFIIVQIILGVLVLFSGVNLYLASMHQISSIFLIVSYLYLLHRTIASQYRGNLII